ncbi:MAG: hypothetical protein ACLP50_14365 [Solirubrobacteraceae bacterium]
MSTRARRILGRLRRTAAELDYAQRRLLELRTGIPLTPETERALARAETAKLETLYAQPDRDPEPTRSPDPEPHSREAQTRRSTRT